MNKCEELKLEHAWRDDSYMLGMSMQSRQKCANCGLTREKYSETKEWYAYSDGRSEPIIPPMRGV